MDIFFHDPSEIPLPPEEVRLRELRATPWQDGQRVKIYLEVDPFQKRPNAQVTITNTAGMEVARVSILETMTRKMEFNMHLREPKPGGEYTVETIIYYQKLPTQEESLSEGLLPDPLIVDRRKVTFSVSRLET
jgi:hypothetical protein